LPFFSNQEFDEKDFREYVKTEMKKWNVPGAAVLLIKDGKIIFSEGFGYRDMEKKLPVTPETIFPIASCTKTFTPFSVGLLVDEGKVDWDAPIRNYYPELMMYDRYATEHITLRDVLTHRSGLPRHDRVWMYSGLSRDELMSRLRYLQPSRGFRETFQYNNITYSIAGLVVEKVSGLRWEDFVRERLFRPLGMDRSSLFVDEMKKTGNYSLAYAPRKDAAGAKKGDSLKEAVQRIPIQAYNTTGPASCINSNLKDMAKWIMFNLNGGKAGEKQLVSARSVREIHSPQISIPTEGEFKPFVGEETPLISYGLGWVVQPFHGHMMLNHSGGVDGFSSLVSFLPGEKAGVVVLTNMQTNMLPYIVAFHYYDLLFGLKPVDRGPKFRESLEALLREMHGGAKAAAGRTDLPPGHPLQDYTGTYAHPAYGSVRVALDHGGLRATYRNVRAPLKHLSGDVFQVVFPYPSGDLNLRMTFGMNDRGEVSVFIAPLEAGVDEIRFQKTGSRD
jgi:CubicO group peptidase (beta-lactamase class C family)